MSKIKTFHNRIKSMLKQLNNCREYLGLTKEGIVSPISIPLIILHCLAVAFNIIMYNSYKLTAKILILEILPNVPYVIATILHMFDIFLLASDDARYFLDYGDDMRVLGFIEMLFTSIYILMLVLFLIH